MRGFRWQRQEADLFERFERSWDLARECLRLHEPPWHTNALYRYANGDPATGGIDKNLLESAFRARG